MLENIYQHEQTWLRAQSHTLTDANTVAVNMQNWINTLNGQGKDTTPFEADLAAFNSQVAAAQTAYDTALGILSADAGFASSGQVTDRVPAANTLRQA